jgi:cobalt/nickel transport system permease protein
LKPSLPCAADPRLKLAAAACLMGAALAAPRAGTPLTVAAFALAALLAATGWRGVPRRTLAVAWALGAGAALLRALLVAGPPLLQLSLFGHALELSRPGLAQAGLLLSRVFATTLAAAWLASSTPLRDLAAALAWARCPAQLLDLLLLAARYRHVLGEALVTLRCAQTMRLGYVGAGRANASTGALAGALACRAIDQSAATAEAMLLRGDSGSAALLLPQSPARANLLVALGSALALACAALRWSAAW